MKLAFLGSPELSANVLEALCADHDVALVVTQPPRKRGRGSDLVPTPVETFARTRNIEVAYSPDAVAGSGAELGVVVAYGALIRTPALDATPYINIHYSLLPRWRGAAPVERAILAGDAETGVCIMQVVKALDAGDVYVSEVVPIADTDYAHDLYEKLNTVGISLLKDVLSRPLPTPVLQTGEPTYAEKLERDEFRIDWKNSAANIMAQIRCDRAWTMLGDEPFRILRASPIAKHGEPGSVVEMTVFTGDGAIALERVQPAGKREMDADAWVRGTAGAEIRFV